MILDVGLVFSRPGVGPSTGGQYGGVPLSVGPETTRILRHDGVEMRLPNADMELWVSPFRIAARAHGVRDLSRRPGWEWLRWTIADHVQFDHERESDAGIEPVMDEDPLVIIPCGMRKQSGPAPAGEMYLGSYHALCLRAARAITSDSNIRILSGLYGLLALDRVIYPYEMRLGDEGCITAEEVMKQAVRCDLTDARNVVVLGGKDYVRLATQVWPGASTPLAGCRGIGAQQARLARIASVGRRALHAA